MYRVIKASTNRNMLKSPKDFYPLFDSSVDDKTKKAASKILWSWYAEEEEEFVPNLSDVLDMCDAATDSDERRIVLTALGESDESEEDF